MTKGFMFSYLLYLQYILITLEILMILETLHDTKT